MALTHVQLCEALKPKVGEEAARLMAEVVPPPANLATKQDLAEAKGELRSVIAELRGEIRSGIATVEAKIEATSRRTLQWVVGLFLPVWAATFGMLFYALVKL